MSKQVIEPYEFQCKTNIEEHNDIVNKVNEIVGVVNEMDVEEITKDISALESEVSAQGNEIDAINTEVAGLPTKTEVSNADVTAVAVDKTSAGIEIQLTRPAGVLEDSVALPFINTATLIPTSTDRAFKIRFTYTDGTQYDTNEFVIPEGGGTDVSVTGVTVEDGTAPNSFKVAIQLSDASTIASNDYEIDIPAQQNTYPTSVSGTLSGSTLTLTIGLNNSTNVTGTADLSTFLTKTEASTTYATKTEVTAVDTKVNAIGVTTANNNVSVNGKTATIINSISGQVTDGNLKITVNGVESGDIPLPDSKLPIISMGSNVSTIDIDISSSTINNDNNQTTYTFIQRSTATLSAYQTYLSGEKSLSRVLGNNGTSKIGTSYENSNNYMQGITTDFTITLPSSFPMGLENGNYKMAVDFLSNANGMSVMRKSDMNPSDDEFIHFTVSNYTATPKSNTITLPHDKFICQGNYTPNKLLIIHDRILPDN